MNERHARAPLRAPRAVASPTEPPCTSATAPLEGAARPRGGGGGAGQPAALTTTSLSSTRFLLMVVDFPSHFCTWTRTPPSKFMVLCGATRSDRGSYAVEGSETGSTPPWSGGGLRGHSKFWITRARRDQKIRECRTRQQTKSHTRYGQSKGI